MKFVQSLFCAFYCIQAFGQVYSDADSAAIEKALKDTYPIESVDPDAALARYDSLFELSTRLGFDVGMGKSRLYKGILMNDRGHYTEAVHLYQQALPYFHRAGYEWGIAGAHNNLGVTYNLTGELDSAATHYLYALEHYESIADTNVLLIVYSNTGGIFSELSQPDKAREYFERGLEVARAFGDSTRLADALINVGLSRQSFNQVEEAQDYYRQAYVIGRSLDHAGIAYLASNNLSDVFYQINESDSSLVHGRRALKYALQSENPFHIVHAGNNLGLRLAAKGEYAEALDHLQESIATARSVGHKRLYADGLLYSAEILEAMGSYKAAYDTLSLHLESLKSLSEEKQSELVNELEAKYQSAKKDREIAEKNLHIAEQQARTERQRSLIVFFASALLVLVFIALNFYRSYRHKTKIQEERYLRLQQQSEMETLKARIEGEELERKRLARELHDGIGGQLAMMRAQVDIEEQRESLAMALQKTDKEVRRIAHNLMPEILLKHGLRAALEAFVEQCDERPYPVSIEVLSEPEAIGQERELILYRITQELVKNAIKHARPSHIFVQLAADEDGITLTVEDDGVGMAASGNNGMGLLSINDRLKAVEGRLEISSTPDVGTSVIVELPLENVSAS